MVFLRVALIVWIHEMPPDVEGSLVFIFVLNLCGYLVSKDNLYF